jgi:hypothetical protein
VLSALVQTVLSGAHEAVRSVAAWALGKFGAGVRPEVLAALVQALLGNEEPVRRGAAFALGMLMSRGWRIFKSTGGWRIFRPRKRVYRAQLATDLAQLPPPYGPIPSEACDRRRRDHW